MKEITTRINYFVSGFVSILGITLIYEVISENDFSDKLDDILMVVLGIVAVWWYKKIGYKSRSSVPAVIISGIAVLLKIMAIVIEHADKEAVGDDIGILIALISLFIFASWQTFLRKKSE